MHTMEFLRSITKFLLCRTLLFVALGSFNCHLFAKTLPQIVEWQAEAEKGGFSGVVLVAHKSKIILKAGFGLGDRENKFNFSSDSVFDLLSLTKQFTAAAILKLEEKGILNLDHTIDNYLDEVPKDKKRITLHHLLTHTSGLKRDYRDDYDIVSKKTLLRGVFRSKLRYSPGSRYYYSNIGYSLLGIIIEKVTGNSYERYLRESFFDPLNMQSTGYVLPRWERKHLVIGYRDNPSMIDFILNLFGQDDRWGSPLEHEWAEDGPWWNIRANGGMLSTLDNMYLWLNALKENKVLSEVSREKLFKPHVSENNQDTSFYGYGWVISESRRGTRVTWHDGANPYFYTNITLYVDEDVLIIFSTNDRRPKNLELFDQLRNAIFSN